MSGEEQSARSRYFWTFDELVQRTFEYSTADGGYRLSGWHLREMVKDLHERLERCEETISALQLKLGEREG